MPALFSPRATTLARAALAAFAALLIAAPAAAIGWVRTPWARGEHVRIRQPVAFSHPMHVTGLRIDCRYCHAGAERSARAGVPSTRQCVTCHSRLWLSSAPMAPIRQSVATGRPIPWARVTQLPDFVYFDHSIHVHKGVGCETCHGRVDRMETVTQAAPLTMQWCVDCHRDPAPALRPVEAITAMGWTPGASSDSLGRVLEARYLVRRLTNCTTCHR